MPDKVAIIDLDSLCFTAFHPNKQLDEFGEPMRTEDNKRFLYIDKTEDEIKQSCDNLMRIIINQSESTHYLAFIKGKNTIGYKLEIDPMYKQDRIKDTPKMWDFTKKYFINEWEATEVDNIEVDDAVNIARLTIPNSFICAIDSDLLGLEGTHYNWKKGEWVTKTKEEQDLKFYTEMIKGSHNGTKGIKGKGDKYVEKLFNTLGSDLTIYPEQIMNEYVNQYGKELGEKEYYKNWKCLIIKDSYESIEFKKPININTIYAKKISMVNEKQLREFKW